MNVVFEILSESWNLLEGASLYILFGIIVAGLMPESLFRFRALRDVRVEVGRQLVDAAGHVTDLIERLVADQALVLPGGNALRRSRRAAQSPAQRAREQQPTHHDKKADRGSAVAELHGWVRSLPRSGIASSRLCIGPDDNPVGEDGLIRILPK